MLRPTFKKVLKTIKKSFFNILNFFLKKIENFALKNLKNKHFSYTPKHEYLKNQDFSYTPKHEYLKNQDFSYPQKTFKKENLQKGFPINP